MYKRKTMSRRVTWFTFALIHIILLLSNMEPENRKFYYYLVFNPHLVLNNRYRHLMAHLDLTHHVNLRPVGRKKACASLT